MDITKRSKGLMKRIAQDDLQSTVDSFRQLCVASGGDTSNDICDTLTVINGINALLAGADPCAQQNVADSMIDFAKGPGISADKTAAMIANAQSYRQHPRNALNINGITPSTPFCEQAPRNSELDGLFQQQLAGVDPGEFGGPNFPIVDFGASGTCPFGQTPDVATCSCN